MADFVGADRALKRLKVTEIDPADLQQPPVVDLELSLDAARRRLDADAPRLRGRARRRSDGSTATWPAAGPMATGAVGDRLQRLEAWVRADDTLKDAFGEMLLYDAGWVAVLDDDDRFLGVLTPDSLFDASRRSLSG